MTSIYPPLAADSPLACLRYRCYMNVSIPVRYRFCDYSPTPSSSWVRTSHNSGAATKHRQYDTTLPLSLDQLDNLVARLRLAAASDGTGAPRVYCRVVSRGNVTYMLTPVDLDLDGMSLLCSTVGPETIELGVAFDPADGEPVPLRTGDAEVGYTYLPYTLALFDRYRSLPDDERPWWEVYGVRPGLHDRRACGVSWSSLRIGARLCTRRSGHSGDHIAHNLGGNEVEIDGRLAS